MSYTRKLCCGLLLLSFFAPGLPISLAQEATHTRDQILTETVAVLEQDLDRIQLLLQFQQAVETATDEALRQFITANPESYNLKLQNGLTPLHVAALRGYTDLVEELLDAGATINSRGIEGATALHLAAHQGHGAVVRILIERDADSSLKAGPGVTALEIAQANDRTEVVSLLKRQR